MTPNTPCKAVILDLFGTLVPGVPKAEYQALAAQMAHAIGAPETAFIDAWHRSVAMRAAGAFDSIAANIAYICQELAIAPPPLAIGIAEGFRHSFMRAHMEPRSEAIAVLQDLAARGLRLGLISDCAPDVVDLWPETPLAPLFDDAILSAAVKLTKPDPRIFHLSCERLSVHPSECLFVGDGGSQELTGATAVGMRAIQILPDGEAATAHRINAQEWSGPRITNLTQVFDHLA